MKQRLAANTNTAIEAGVFGVSTLVLRDRLFWGGDTVDWALHFVEQPDLFDERSYQAAARSEFGAARHVPGGVD
ncbi:hypothetical protein QTI66_37550 [Variovorax sp. J22R133]|uniref:hypothetical protein n=1 Tax=Variovorax brevis TaxID=3053503 RepID=UPI002575FC93|nr:hypothetical protein [Variovorax sp. J22R133]MDM0117804.1 hypothetical protein [Variovorax sp. J22R133]